MDSPSVSSRLRRPGAFALALALAAATAGAVGVAGAEPSKSDLQNQISLAQQREHRLQGSIQRENDRIGGFQGTIDDLNARLHVLETTLARERTQLQQTQGQLRDARVKLSQLRHDLARDRRALAEQLVAQYEMPEEDVVSVVVNAHGFSGLLEKIDDLDRLRSQNVKVTTRVTQARRAVAIETRRLARLERRRQIIENGTYVQRDEVARLRLAVVNKQMAFVRERTRDRGQLGSLQGREHDLQTTLHRIEAREAAAVAAPALGGITPSVTNAPFAAHGGSSGFFQAPGTNYSVGVEPIIAARLDKLGKALGLHLIGISGYRTPEHSVEVGGFPNDPHTQGRASDTPGVEGVPEATLNQFGLTRPFGGAAEADHIQLLGG